MPIITPPRAPRRRAPQIVRLDEGRDAHSFAEAVRAGLTARPKTLPCQFFYDAVGSQLFERICELPEYYLTRTEEALLTAHAEAMVAGFDRPPTIVELGSGSSTKTRQLLATALRRHESLHYVPIDVSPTILEASAEALCDEFPGLSVTGFAADYRVALGTLRTRVRGPKLFVFLGSSLGNYEPAEAVALLGHVARAADPADRFLLGVDLDKDPAVLEAAYDDAQGVTAQFNRNLLARINAELDADFDLGRFEHEARYRRDRRRVEMHLVSRCDQAVRIGGAGLTVRFAGGESIHTENSHKYTVESLGAIAAQAGFAVESRWIDPLGRFAVERWRPGRSSS